MKTVRALLFPLLLALPLAGCVERKFLVRSDPPGALVRINGVPAGRTPLEIPFIHYGVVRLEAAPVDVDGDGFPEYEGFSEPFDLRPPWYQWFPLDFFSDNLWPATLRDRHEVILVLRPALDPMEQADEAEMRKRLPGLRIRAQRERTLQEAAPPEEGK